ncbi:MFS general substrate transporter [Cylindrobasidium torrendii FP15055 ss-10]|uniref:MFS general substrate transporter n=1 Tax=Cylindrobasidium torrendii FP15055 ss-10 TaxID=1314674 RepID=A0A0D7BK69_9AGAR|nr:MFS general substrate transporter [Cylindrobasidium torrendii FP15055 ss-10]
MSFFLGTKPSHGHPELGSDIGPSVPRLRASEGIEHELGYELHHLDRVRRPSAVRLESSGKISFQESLVESPSIPYTRPASALSTSEPREESSVNPALKKKQRRLANIQFAAICFMFFVEGWNDGTTGPLLPTMQEHYNIGFTLVSMLFVFACIGFILGACLNVWINEKVGFGKATVFASMFQIVAYALASPAPPFPVIVLGYFLAGFGISIQNAQGNGFVGSLKEHKTTCLNIMHGMYGAGAFVAPLVSTPFSKMPHWSYHYIISTGLAVLNTTILILVFKGKRQEELLADAGQEPAEAEDTVGANIYRAFLSLPSVHLMSLFAIIYVGTEVTLGGWIVTFIINERSGGKSSGYISSGFFGGLTVGRLALIWVSKKIGERRVVFLYAFAAIALELTIWFVPSIIENAVAVSFIGILLGPMYPILVGHAAKILPRWLFTGSVGWISGIGFSGSAALPFITGLLASKFGIKSLQPFIVSMMCTMVGLWALVPRAPRHRD